MTRIADAFTRNGAAFMPYMMGGFPSLERSLEIGHAYVDGGADIIELGVPFSDPLADGPVIHAAATEALANGATFSGVLDIARELAPRVPVVIMCYANLLLARELSELAQTGAAGLIVPDLPLEESEAMLEACDSAGLALIPLVAPTTTDERLAAIGARARGFVYTVSVTGTTGERAAVDASELVRKVRANTEVPVAVGFGISTPEQAAAVARAGADGVIVGSRLVRAAAAGEDVGELVSRFRFALG
jgi:tryptophan synthase alpha chain